MPDTATDNPIPHRRWLQFRLKTLLLIVAVLCVPLAWAGVRMNQKRQEREVIAEIERLGGTVQYDWEGERVDGIWEQVSNRKLEPASPRGLRWLLGDDFFGHVAYVFLPPSERVFFQKHKYGQSISLQYTNGSGPNDHDLRLVASITGLEILDLSYAEIGDAGLAYLKGVTSLRCLTLSRTDITDAGLRHLKSLTNLKRLYLDGTKSTSAAVDDLRKALPECDISWHRVPEGILILDGPPKVHSPIRNQVNDGGRG